MSKIYPGMATKIEHTVIDGKEYKACPNCKELKSLEEYGVNKAARNGSGRQYTCKVCMRARCATHYRTSPSRRERTIEQAKESQKRKKEKKNEQI